MIITQSRINLEELGWGVGVNNLASNLQFLYVYFFLPLFARCMLKYVTLIKTKLQSD